MMHILLYLSQNIPKINGKCLLVDKEIEFLLEIWAEKRLNQLNSTDCSGVYSLQSHMIFQ